MPPKRNPVPRARDAWVWLGGIFVLGILGGGVVVAAVLLWETVDIRQLAPDLVGTVDALPVPELANAPAVDAVAFDAVLFNSNRNRRYFPDATYYPAEIDRWRDLIREVGGALREAGDAEQLRALTADEVLVLVEAPCLSRAETEAVRAHVARGGNVVANWAVGVRDAECEWRGWGTVLELTEAEEVQELPPREGLFLTIPAGTGLSAGFDPGTRIELWPDASLALRTPGPRVYWSDWALNPAPDEGGFGADVAAITTRSSAGGRTTWFGLRAGQAATATDSVRLRRLLQNGVLWAAGTAMAAPAAWPGAAAAALMFTLDVEAEPHNAIDMAALLESQGVPGTFFAVSQLVAGDRTLAEALRRSGEVGTQTADHSPLAGRTAIDQAVRLRRSWADVERWTGLGPTGLRPPEDAFDSSTVQAWQEAGGEYILARNEARSASPEIHGTPEGVIVVLPRLLKDDYNIVVQDRAIRANRIGDAYLLGTRKLHAIGGLAIVSGHTQIMKNPRRLDAYRLVAESARADGDWWIARGGEVARWWRSRSEARVAFVPPDGAQLRPSMSPSGISDLLVSGSDLEDVWIDVVLPDRCDALVPLVDGHSVEFVATAWGIRVPVGTLTAGNERRISLVHASPTGKHTVPGS